MKWLCLVLLLTGCGGGGGSGGVQMIPPVVAAVQRPDLLFMYFGVMGAQIKETAAHVNAILLMAWNFENWTPAGRPAIANNMLAQIEEAIASGITKVILGVDFLIFDRNYRVDQGVEGVRPLVEQLKSKGLWDSVVALYPVDEPDLQGIPNDVMNAINVGLKQQFGKPIACIYTDRRQWPGLGTVDWAGFDKYGVDVHGDGVLADLKSLLRQDQRILLVAGGADPWRDNVRPVLDYANSDSQVVGIVAFIYGVHGQDKGIRDNGMAVEYAEVGGKIKRSYDA